MRKVTVPLHLLKEAERECLKSDVVKARVCALLMDGKRVFRRDHNRIVAGAPHKFSAHAEESLLSKIGKPYGTLIVLRYLPGKDCFGDSRPCDKCMRLILKTSISRIVYCLGESFYEETI